MKPITIATAAISGRIYAGHLNKAKTAFLDGKQDVTSDVLKAIIDMIKPGHYASVEVGESLYEIEVKEVTEVTHAD